MIKVVILERKKNIRGYGKISKVKIEGDKCLSLYIIWAQKIPKINNLQKAWIQANANACGLNPSWLRQVLVDQQ